MNTVDYDLVILGRGPAGLTAGVYAAGDVRNPRLRQIATAVGDAAKAAYSAQHYIESLRK